MTGVYPVKNQQESTFSLHKVTVNSLGMGPELTNNPMQLTLSCLSHRILSGLRSRWAMQFM